MEYKYTPMKVHSAALFGISGPAGSGKSTLLKALDGYCGSEYDIVVAPNKVSREVQAEMGITNLDDYMSSMDRVIEMQHRVYEKLRRTVLELTAEEYERPTIVLQERSFLDVNAYTLLWYKKMVDQGKEVTNLHYVRLNNMLETGLLWQRMYDGVVHVPRFNSIPDDNDPNRAPDRYRDTWNTTYGNNLRKYGSQYFFELGRQPEGFYVNTLTVEDRRDECIKKLDECYEVLKSLRKMEQENIVYDSRNSG